MYGAYVIMAAGALIAVGSYIRQGYIKRKVAATLLVIQIDEIEGALNEFKLLLAKGDLRNEVVIKTKLFLCNAWNDGKHLLLNKLCETDRKTLSRYFSEASFIHEAREKINISLVNHWNARAMTLAFQFADIVDADNVAVSEDEIKKVNCFFNKYVTIDNAFIPDIPTNILIENISTWETLSGTTTYARLKKLSYVNN